MFKNALVQTETEIRSYRPSDEPHVRGLLLCGFGLGDVICMVPCVRKLVSYFGKTLDVWTYRPEVFKYEPGVKVHVYNDDRVRASLVGGGVLFVTPVSHEGEPGRHQMHLIDHSAMHLIPLDDADKSFSLASAKQAQDQAELILETCSPSVPRVLIHASRNVPIRTWQTDRWVQLAKVLLEEGCAVFAVGRSLEHPQSATIVHLKQPLPLRFENPLFFDLTDQLSLHVLYELVKRVGVVVTADSGLLHVANCSETPVVCLFTNIDPAIRMRYRDGQVGARTLSVFGPCSFQFCDTHFGPQGEACRLEDPEKKMQCLPSVEAVLDAVRQSLSQSTISG